MKKFLLYGHGGSYNHGCETIAKCTINLIRSKYKDAFITLSSHFPEQDREFNINADEIIGPDLTVWEKEKTAAEEDKMELSRLMYKEALSKITRDTVCLSIGGDVFCYNNWHRLAVFQSKAGIEEAKSILWGCSIEPDMITPAMNIVLNTYNHIIARESDTYNALLSKGIKSDIQLAPDPAFLLEKEETELTKEFLQGNNIGINISPLITRKEKKENIIKENIKKLMKYILTETDMNIILIPHVTMPMDNDYTILKELLNLFKSEYSKKIFLAEEKFSASKLKYLISKCKIIVCSRTHASIAAYSQGVPVIVLGYSVKSKGIAKDLDLSEYVLDVSGINTENDVLDIYKKLNMNIDAVKRKLEGKVNKIILDVNKYMDYI